MTASTITRAKHFVMRHRRVFQDGAMLAGLVCLATVFAYHFDIFENPAGLSPQDHIIELDEALALLALLCIGLMIMCRRTLLAQRREMMRRVAAESRARELAHQDTLTGLPNRRQFQKELKEAIAAPPGADGTHALLLLDLNDFKRINDIYGHATGDEVLINVAARLQSAVRRGDLVVRFGGDEFAVLARQLSGPEEATNISLRIIREIEKPIPLDAVQHRIGVGIGIALFPHDTRDATEITRRADVALYRAKAEHKSAQRFHDSEMDARLLERDMIERELRAAVANGDIQPFYQPLIDLRTQRVAGFEALARWIHPTLGDVAPERFIPVAENCGLIEDLSYHLLRQATRAATSWPDDVVLAFNISLLQLSDKTLGLRILHILGESGLPTQRLEVELTESALVRDPEAAQITLGALRDAGVRIALDDFGTGYSSIYHLRNFKIDKIKIDRSFLRRVGEDSDASTFLGALLGLGHGLGLTVTAEGVEDAAQAAALAEQGCEQAQGFLYSDPMPVDATLAFIARQSGAEKARKASKL
ncbi:EAL domain-containing protein [[Pseudomonas] carboxydohydrogena]|uniref:EAL domain-containing protein n=1 Tax=Afipia carboxydohydrogena TaxID=290 RepID=A0ABY8BRR2_AFICR|nr:EAL domain-containing protein [[Pseudomonas] carboxydohydrogena]WEF52653.1 EAL domain-containing protein [[Pseudomonas] carboxydohydrogena]